ncbi:MAG: riboflavin biosynthesis protein RibF [bacterium]|jgi:riboflavin kinase/FMN adenylyltransferase|nr:riboflavin biosynthesis protein RibF [bacterium]
MMYLFNDFPLPKHHGGRVITVGVFDGLHIGHQLLLSFLKEKAEALGAFATVVTFNSHPDALLYGISPLLLTTTEEKRDILQSMAIDELLSLDFTTELAATDAEEFIRDELLQAGMCELVAGPDFALGKGRGGTFEALERLAADYAFGFHRIDHALWRNKPVSSTRIREALDKGDMHAVSAMLGRLYSAGGTVVKGRMAGRGLGFPTANLSVAREKLLPANGVYAGYAILDGERLPAVANIGFRPTFGSSERSFEVHIIGFSGNIYGRKLSMYIVERLRDEEAFADPLLLQRRISLDVEAARAKLADIKIKEQ